MNATGIGNKFLIRAALYLALITASVAAFNALWLAPWSQDKEAHLMEQFAAENSVDLLQKATSNVRQMAPRWCSSTILKIVSCITCLWRS